MKLLVLIFSCKKNLDRCVAIQQSWLQDLKQNHVEYFFVSADELDIQEPQIKLKNFTECYEQLPLKTFLTLKQICNYNFTHLIKTDDDVYLNIKKLIKTLSQNVDYSGKFNLKGTDASMIHYYKCNKQFKTPKKQAHHDYAEGGMYVLSKKAAKHIASHDQNAFINSPKTYKGEDVVVGELLSNEQFIKLDLTDNLSDKLNMDITINDISYHPVHKSLMHKLYKAKTTSNRIHILVANAAKNDYNKRDIFIRKYEQ
jgi:hypothetical protein